MNKNIKLLKLALISVVIYSCTGNSQTPSQSVGLQPTVTTQSNVAVTELLDTDSPVWGLDFISNNEIIFTKKSGELSLLNSNTRNVYRIEHNLQVLQTGQGGLLDVRVLPEFNRHFEILVSYSKKVGSTQLATTALALLVLELNSSTNKWQVRSSTEIFEALAASRNAVHFGARIDFENRNKIFLSVGDRNERNLAQSGTVHNGKIIQLDRSASNQFASSIFSLGHRNPQGLYWSNTQQKLFSAEFGPYGGDELNVVEKNKNYGWPIITYGLEYSGEYIGPTSQPGLEQPLVYWTPSISPSAMIIYENRTNPSAHNNAFLACLSGLQIRKVDLTTNQQTILLEEKNWRFRSLRQGPDGKIYYGTDDGRIGFFQP